MQINFTGHQLDITEALKNYTTKRFQPLANRGESINKIDVVFEDNEARKIFTAKATLFVHGQTIHADASSDDMYKSIDELERKLERQIRRHREKEVEHR